MKRDLTLMPLDLSGNPMKDGEPKYKRRADGGLIFDEVTSQPIVLEPAKDATFRTVLMTLLSAPMKEDQDESGEKKLAKFRLADKIVKAEAMVDLSSEDVSLISARAEKLLPWLTFARVKEWLETDPQAATT